MKRYVINNRGITPKINNYTILSTNDNSVGGFYEFYFNNPHFLSEESVIGVSDSYDNVLYENRKIYLRPQVRIGITATRHIKWRYADNSNNWVDLGVVSGNITLTGYTDSIYQPGTFSSTFSITLATQAGLIVVKESHALDFQEVIKESDLPSCGTYSDDSIVTSVSINDTFLRIVSFESCREINILKSGWNDQQTQYIFTTDYGYNYTDNKWFDHLFSSPCGCQRICVNIRETTLDDISVFEYRPKFVDSDITHNELFKVDSPPPNPDGIYGGVTVQPAIEPEPVCQTVNIQLITCQPSSLPCNNIDDCNNNGTDLPYTFVITTPIDYTKIVSMYRCFSLDCLKLWKDVSAFSIELGLDFNFSVNAGRSEAIESEFIEEEKKNLITPILDNERVQFEPYWDNGDGTFTYINHIKYQLTFIETKPSTYTPEEPSKWRTLGFTDDDVKYQKSRLKKTFVRLSYYNSPNPSEYLLEHYNTVFVDTNMMYSDFMYGINNISGVNYNTKPISKYPDDGFNTTFHVYNPDIRRIERKKDLFVSYSNSSEGYFLYLYGTEYKDQIPNFLYMKIEFNNAMDGKRTLFFNDKTTTGVDMDNVFFDKTHAGYIWTRIIVTFNKDLQKYIWYPDITYPNVSKDSTCKNTMIIKAYESHVK